MLHFLSFPSIGNSLVFLLIFTGVIYAKMYHMLKKKTNSSSLDPVVRHLWKHSVHVYLAVIIQKGFKAKNCVALNVLILHWLTLFYDRCGWHSCPKHNLWRALADDRVHNDEKVASSKNNIPSSRQECKNHIQFMTKMSKIDSLFMTTHTYIVHIREYRSPPPSLPALKSQILLALGKSCSFNALDGRRLSWFLTHSGQEVWTKATCPEVKSSGPERLDSLFVMLSEKSAQVYLCPDLT